MQRKHLIKDSIWATAGVFLVMALFAYFPFNLKILDPLKHGLKDFEFSDIYYSKIKTKAPVDTNIIIVNIGYNNRAQLAQQLAIIRAQQPAVIGLDVLLRSKKEFSIDSLLEAEINSTPNIVMGSLIDWREGNTQGSVLDTTALGLQNKTWGFINVVAPYQEAPIRKFIPFYQASKKDAKKEGFAAAIVHKYNPKAFEKLEKRGKKDELINYSRRLEQYTVVDVDRFENPEADFSFMKDKIVLMGFLGPDIKTPVMEDNRFTPMNKKFSGKSFPDMYGVVIHANIISMVLSGDYVKEVPWWLSTLIAFIICFIHVYFFTRFYVRHHKFFHLVTKIIQLLTFTLMVYASFMLMSFFGLKLEMGAILASIALSVDVLYFYDGFAVWLHKKFGYNTVFSHH